MTDHKLAPKSQQAAQDEVLRLFQKTVDAIPGSKLDSSRFGGNGETVDCDDNATSPDSPVDYSQSRDLRLPPGAGYPATVAKLGDVWTSWGWKVVERDDFPKPNRFAQGSNGYRLQVELNNHAYPAIVTAISPCFTGALAKRDIPMPVLIESRTTD